LLRFLRSKKRFKIKVKVKYHIPWNFFHK
jgi:hypothetical protein